MSPIFTQGRPGAEHSWRAYCRGMANLYVAKHAPLHQNLTKGAVTLAGMVMGGDLQCQVYAKIEVGYTASSHHSRVDLFQDRRATSTNEQLSDLVSRKLTRNIFNAITFLVEYETRVEMVLNQLLPTCETLIFAGGGDRGIYAAAKSVVNSVDTCERVILLRIDPHMDERSVYCRSDPNKRKLVHVFTVNRTIGTERLSIEKGQVLPPLGQRVRSYMLNINIHMRLPQGAC